MPAKAGYFLLAGGGAVLLWSGVRGKSATGVLHNLIGGQSPAQAGNVNDLATVAGSSGASGDFAMLPGANTGGTPGQNQTLAKMLASAMGHSDWTVGQEWSDWVALWTKESGWNQTAQNPGSGAYGIPQSLPGSKMASVGSDWKTNPVTQIRWGITYIEQTYGSPSAAWAHEQSRNWY
jgi:resuscitation-promoting factor RpfB